MTTSNQYIIRFPNKFEIFVNSDKDPILFRKSLSKSILSKVHKIKIKCLPQKIKMAMCNLAENTAILPKQLDETLRANTIKNEMSREIQIHYTGNNYYEISGPIGNEEAYIASIRSPRAEYIDPQVTNELECIVSIHACIVEKECGRFSNGTKDCSQCIHPYIQAVICAVNNNLR